jgi:hypothetical protein
MIILEPTSGLCNRMRAIDSAVALGKILKKKVTVIWYRDYLLNCSFSELFKPIESIDKIIEFRFITRFDREIFQRLSKLIMKAYCHHFLSNNDIIQLKKNGSVYQFLNNKNCVCIRTYQSFFKPEQPYAIFKPQNDLAKIIDTYNINHNFIGVHIRRMDNLKSIENSPTELFIKQLEEEIERDPAVKFFVASDSLEDKKLISNHFPDRVKQHNVEDFNRNKPEAIKNALIDLYCLAGCRKIIGSYWSSFSTTASKINNVDLLRIKKSV